MSLPHVDNLGMIGSRYGQLVILAMHGYQTGHRYWHAICDCGRHHIVEHGAIRGGHTKSCGCLRRGKPANLSHGCGKSLARGGRATPEYNAWSRMRQRCLNPRDPKFPDYGARGISVCDEWVFDFMAFLTHVGQRPSKLHSLGRIDNEGNYEPGNVEWQTSHQQARNKRNNRYLTAFGKTKLISEFAREYDIRLQFLVSRLRSGNYTAEDALTQPIGKRGGYKPRRKSHA